LVVSMSSMLSPFQRFPGSDCARTGSPYTSKNAWMASADQAMRARICCGYPEVDPLETTLLLTPAAFAKLSWKAGMPQKSLASPSTVCVPGNAGIWLQGFTVPALTVQPLGLPMPQLATLLETEQDCPPGQATAESNPEPLLLQVAMPEDMQA